MKQRSGLAPSPPPGPREHQCPRKLCPPTGSTHTPRGREAMGTKHCHPTSSPVSVTEKGKTFCHRGLTEALPKEQSSISQKERCLCPGPNSLSSTTIREAGCLYITTSENERKSQWFPGRACATGPCLSPWASPERLFLSGCAGQGHRNAREWGFLESCRGTRKGS